MKTSNVTVSAQTYSSAQKMSYSFIFEVENDFAVFQSAIDKPQYMLKMLHIEPLRFYKVL